VVNVSQRQECLNKKSATPSSLSYHTKWPTSPSSTPDWPTQQHGHRQNLQTTAPPSSRPRSAVPTDPRLHLPQPSSASAAAFNRFSRAPSTDPLSRLHRALEPHLTASEWQRRRQPDVWGERRLAPAACRCCHCGGVLWCPHHGVTDGAQWLKHGHGGGGGGRRGGGDRGSAGPARSHWSLVCRGSGAMRTQWPRRASLPSGRAAAGSGDAIACRRRHRRHRHRRRRVPPPSPPQTVVMPPCDAASCR